MLKNQHFHFFMSHTCCDPNLGYDLSNDDENRFPKRKTGGKNPKGLFVTWIVNWLIKPFYHVCDCTFWNNFIKNLLFMECLWTLHLTCIFQAKRWIKDGKIGRMLYIDCYFSFFAPESAVPRLYDKNLGTWAERSLKYFVGSILWRMFKRAERIRPALFK